ncbi:MAG: HAMP domain-containing sensor histidine kinase [Myxococcota bacterium]
MFAYDVDFKSLNDKSPPFPPKLAAELRSGAEVASARMSGRRRIHIAVRMPWSDGPCAVLLLQTKGPPPWLSFAVLLPAALVTLVVILVSLIVAGPLVARVRRLTEAVDGNLPIVEDGNDEITDLGRAFQRNRKTIEAQVQSLTEREAALRNYIANTSHDVMLPLSVLQGHLVALQQQLESGASLGPTAIVPSIEEAQYLGSLLHNLNAAARLQADPGLVHRESIDLNRLVARVAERHRPIAKRRGIDLEYAVPDMPVTFAGDVTLLEQGLGNIVQNAVRYNERGGHVAITLDERPSNWVIRVIDDGPGIPRADRDRVLEPSFRGSQARTRHPHGMGLGLHIAADVASRHGLRLTLDETPGGGLTVTLAPTNRSEPDT